MSDELDDQELNADEQALLDEMPELEDGVGGHTRRSVKGMGELGMVGIPAAIANAVFHATGRRIRELPITPDKLL
jgi:xanthine dehydrogenase YagR molybdenum-binding subunit